jgi:predicted nucleic acid-binding protein
MSYWDTSALVKLYVQEPESALLATTAETTAPIMTCRLTVFEFWRTVYRKEAEGGLLPGSTAEIMKVFRGDMEAGRIAVTGLGLEVEPFFDTALRQGGSLVRSADAIHLASALGCGARQLVCTDVRMREAGQRLGLTVLP